MSGNRDDPAPTKSNNTLKALVNPANLAKSANSATRMHT
jgi:hypothetical protein